MIHYNKHHLSSHRPATLRLKRILLLPVAGAILALSACNDYEANKHTPPVTVTDTKPVGDGLATLAFGIVGAAVVIVLGRLLR